MTDTSAGATVVTTTTVTTAAVAGTAEAAEPAQPSFRIFDVEVARVRTLSPSLSRFTFRGPDLDSFAETGWDQRIKLVLPLPGVGLDHVPRTGEWYSEWRALPAELQNPIRTYTVRGVRPLQQEIDVDIVMHGTSGPASAWATAAEPGDPLVVVGPNAHFEGDCGGVDFAPPAETGLHLLIGDETALPAIAAILENLAPDARGLALIETPFDGDRLALGDHPGIEVRVVARGDGLPGSALIPAVVAATELLFGVRGRRPASDADGLDDVDVDSGVLWDVPGPHSGIPLCDRTDVYAWVAAEAGVVKELRRHFVRDCGLDRSCAAFMGYWRLGRSDIA